MNMNRKKDFAIGLIHAFQTGMKDGLMQGMIVASGMYLSLEAVKRILWKTREK